MSIASHDDEQERALTCAALTRALGGAPAAQAAADALRAAPQLDDAGRGRVSRRIIGAAVLRVRLAFLAGSNTPEALLDAYRTHEEAGAPAGIPWPTDARARLIVEHGCPAPLADALVDSLGLAEASAFLAASNHAGPRTLRANSLIHDRQGVARALADEGIVTRLAALSPWALHVQGKANLFGSAAWRSGAFEVQDEASQLVALATGAQPGDVVIDLCAGRGGKTLALAAMMQDRGTLWAHDVDPRTLADLRPRLARAKVACVREGLPSQGSADVVLVDAPCSSTGVLRRSPDLRFTFTVDDVTRHTATQRALLQQACALVRPGGTVVYATCSVLRAENEDAIAHAPGALMWEERRHLTPQHEGTDGFFIARARRA
jgi:16S rRNA (cytosine967-C5)-methyltransferase